jgi:hypothetical protein
MDERFQAILESLPPKAPPIRLEPYRELICEMRRRGRTYREIAAVLAEQCQVETDLGSIYDLVRARRRAAPRSMQEPPIPPGPPASSFQRDGSESRAQARRPLPPHSGSAGPIFRYNENEPLRFRNPEKDENL